MIDPIHSGCVGYFFSMGKGLVLDLSILVKTLSGFEELCHAKSTSIQKKRGKENGGGGRTLGTLSSQRSC